VKGWTLVFMGQGQVPFFDLSYSRRIRRSFFDPMAIPLSRKPVVFWTRFLAVVRFFPLKRAAHPRSKNRRGSLGFLRGKDRRHPHSQVRLRGVGSDMAEILHPPDHSWRRGVGKARADARALPRPSRRFTPVLDESIGGDEHHRQESD